jgi:ABC-type Fe3+-citrate transport system substrate-binding protein
MLPPVFTVAMREIEKENELDKKLYDPTETFNDIQRRIKENLVSLVILSVEKIDIICSSNNGNIFVAEVFFKEDEESIFMYDNGKRVIWF